MSTFYGKRKQEGFSNAPGFFGRIVGSAISTLLIWALAQYMFKSGMNNLIDTNFYIGIFGIIFLTQCSTFIF